MARLLKLLAALTVLALLAAACSSDDSDESFGADSGSASGAEAGFSEESEGESDSAEATSAVAEGDSADVAADAEAPLTSSDEDAGADADSPAEADSETETADVEDKIAKDEPIENQNVQAGLLTAADIDDNLNFTFFNSYLQRTSESYGQGLPFVSLEDRVVINTVGANGAGLANARLDIDGGNSELTIYTNSIGTAYLFPTASGISNWDALSIRVTPADLQSSETFTRTADDLDADRAVTLELEEGNGQAPAALDLALVIDTTGSMGDELNYLTTEFDSIVEQLSDDYPNVDMRFALVVYRDEGDDYVTRVFDFSDDPAEIQKQMAEQSASGGGDYPEAMDSALAEATDLSWRSGDVARVMIVNADAPPHDNGFNRVLESTTTAREAGIRIYPLAASGVGDTAEYIMRFMAATTGGRHLFLTDDSGIGLAHQEPKVQCYVVSRLNHLLIRVLASELSAERLEPFPDQLIRTVGDYDNGYCSDAN